MTVFRVALAVHVLAGLTSVVAGVLAATARKRPGRHPRAGLVYLSGVTVVCATSAVMAALRWPHDAHLFAIALVAFGLAAYGWRARRRRRPGWVVRHAIGLGGSFIAMMTGFYVDNGARLPVWKLLPHVAYWLVPAAVGIPLIWRALRRYRAGVSSRPLEGAGSAGPRRPRR